MHSEPTAGFFNFMTQKKIIKQLHERIEDLETQKNKAKQDLEQMKKIYKNLESNARVSDEQSTMYKEQNTKLQQDLNESLIKNQQLASKIQEFEVDSSILQYIWNKMSPLQEMEFCMSTYGAWEELQIANTRKKIVQASSFVQYLYKNLYTFIMSSNLVSSQHKGLNIINKCMKSQIKKLQALMHEQEIIDTDRDKLNKLTAKLLYVFNYTDIMVLVSKFGFTDRFYKEYGEKLRELNQATVQLASQDITEERKPLCIMYKNFIYMDLAKIILGQIQKCWSYKFVECFSIEAQMNEKFKYTEMRQKFLEYIEE